MVMGVGCGLGVAGDDATGHCDTNGITEINRVADPVKVASSIVAGKDVQNEQVGTGDNVPVHANLAPTPTEDVLPARIAEVSISNIEGDQSDLLTTILAFAGVKHDHNIGTKKISQIVRGA